MSTTITVNYDKKDYTLEYSRNTVRQMESQGFVLGEIHKKPMTMIPILFYGAFMKHHKGIKRNLVDEIYEHIANKTGETEEEEGLVQVLIEMYADTANTLTENKSSDEGNVATWKVTKG